jgi:hypothetical protein
MTNGCRSIGVIPQVLRCVGLLFLVTPLACAQPEGDGDGPQRLPDAFIGQWAPSSTSVRRFGTLSIQTDTLTWGTCVAVPYRLLESDASAWLIELVSAPPCRLGLPAPFLVLEASERGLIASICQQSTESQKPLLERSCSWGELIKQSD